MQAMFVSITRLRLRSYRFLPAFMILTSRTRFQAVGANGFLGGELVLDRKLAFWTMTLWTDEAAMLSYRNSDAHRVAMPKLLNWCDEAIATNWTLDGLVAPSWSEAFEKIKNGKLTKVRFPSADHNERSFPPPRLTFGGKLRPAEKSK
jgi:hypothetical protein